MSIDWNAIKVTAQEDEAFDALKPHCPCGQRLDTYEELMAEDTEESRQMAQCYLIPGEAAYCGEEDDVVPSRFWVMR